MVTIQEQEEHLEKIKALVRNIERHEVTNAYPIYLTRDDFDTIKRALACHMAVIRLDLTERSGEGNEMIDMKQPELPIMKNNDQRRDWLRNYRSWGLWYEDKNIGVKYYKYDFDNGARLIATEWTTTYAESCTLHLVGGPEPPPYPSRGYPKWTRHERYNRYPDNETELIEFLKHTQR